MKLLPIASLLAATVAMTQTAMAAPERRIYVTSIGDVLEWRPGLGIVVLSAGRTHTRTVTRISKRRMTTSDGKSVIQLERPARVERSIEIERRGDAARPFEPEAPRARPKAQDEGESLMEEVEPGRVIQ